MSIVPGQGRLEIAYRGGGDVGQVGRNTGSVDDIVEGELVDEGRSLEEEGQRLDCSQLWISRGSTEDSPVQCLRKHLLRQL
jgi:hypothetical protein